MTNEIATGSTPECNLIVIRSLEGSSFVVVVHIADLAHARAQELHSLLHELGQRQTKHRTALQILPRYMRRRAASYNIKRLPRSLRPLADPKTVRYASIDRSDESLL